jgi:hypothetical protein
VGGAVWVLESALAVVSGGVAAVGEHDAVLATGSSGGAWGLVGVLWMGLARSAVVSEVLGAVWRVGMVL